MLVQVDGVDQSGTFYRTLLENCFEGIAIIDGEGRITFQNRAAAEMLGAKEGELIGTSAIELIHPDDLASAMSSLATLNANQGMLFPDEVRMKRRDDGRYVYLETRAVNLSENPEVRGIVVNFRDVTDRRAAMVALSASEKRLELALAASDLSLWDLDLERDRAMFEGRLATSLGLPSAEGGMSREELFDLIHPEDRPGAADAMAAHLEGTIDHFEYEHRLRGKDGNYRWVSARGAIVERDALGKARRFAGTYLDIDRRRLEEQERAQLEDRLQAAQRMESIGQLAGGIAHDFNNVLQIILANAHLAQRANQGARAVSESISQITVAGERAADLTRQLLAFARRQTLLPKPCDVNELIEGVLGMLRRVLPEHIEIDYLPGHALPAALLDPAQFEQVVTNLCLNARDAMAEGGKLTIETENVVINGEYRRKHPWARAGRYVLLSVSDTGVGMDAETQRRAFDPFFTTKGKSGGTGLGLAMVHGTVRQHGGLVHLYSEPGVGTTFKLFWPVAEREATTVGSKLAGPIPRGEETILVAEDDPSVRTLTAQILEAGGYCVLTAADGDAAIETFRANKDVIALVLLDAIMPKRSGREAYEVIATIKPTAVLFATGYSAASLPADFLAEGELEVLPKPYDPDQLLRKVRALLEKGSPTDPRRDPT